jgi:hypothetical protein
MLTVRCILCIPSAARARASDAKGAVGNGQVRALAADLVPPRLIGVALPEPLSFGDVRSASKRQGDEEVLHRS